MIFILFTVNLHDISSVTFKNAVLLKKPRKIMQAFLLSFKTSIKPSVVYFSIKIISGFIARNELIVKLNYPARLRKKIEKLFVPYSSYKAKEKRNKMRMNQYGQRKKTSEILKYLVTLANVT